MSQTQKSSAKKALFSLQGNIMQGQFITLEGSEGGGKSTNLLFIEQFLTE